MLEDHENLISGNEILKEKRKHQSTGKQNPLESYLSAYIRYFRFKSF